MPYKLTLRYFSLGCKASALEPHLHSSTTHLPTHICMDLQLIRTGFGYLMHVSCSYLPSMPSLRQFLFSMLLAGQPASCLVISSSSSKDEREASLFFSRPLCRADSPFFNTCTGGHQLIRMDDVSASWKGHLSQIHIRGTCGLCVI